MPPSKSKSKTPAKVKMPVKAKSRAAVKVPIRTRSSTKAKSPTESKLISKATASTMIVVSSGPVIPTEFTIFSKLPGELQLIVWKNSHSSRIVTLKPSKFQFPALLHACSDSRHECILAGYEVFIRDMKTGLAFSPWRDILLLDRSSFSQSVNYHLNSIHTLKCRKVNLKMLAPVEKLAFSLREVLEVWKTQCFHCLIMNELPKFFPKLKELIIILRPGTLGATHDNLYEVTKYSTFGAMEEYIDDIKKTFKLAQDDGKCKDLKLTLMRTENWAK